jgi:selenocysteine-specific elongation factor
MKNVFSKTKFKNSNIISISANPKGDTEEKEKEEEKVEPIGIKELIEEIEKYTELGIKKEMNEDLIFAVDHCFLIKGKGTILTGTVLQGSLSINQVNIY